MAAMSALLRGARPCFVALLAVTLVVGINGFLGAVHSVHHLPETELAHPHEADAHEKDPAPTSEETCQVAVAAAHSVAIETEALPLIGASTAEAGRAPAGTPDAPRLPWREPSPGRAPPASSPLPS